jgi:stage II sporulation protein M
MRVIAAYQQHLHAYIHRLRPYLTTSIVLFSLGATLGLIIINQFPHMTDSLEESLQAFIKQFRGLPKLELAAAIFLNNSVKTFAMILLGIFFGVVPALFLIANGAALAIVLTLSTQSRGIWLSLLSVVPHGILELPAVFLGTAIGLMMGATFTRRLTTKSEISIGAELGQALKFFVILIVPLLIAAALVEAYVTSALLAR